MVNRGNASPKGTRTVHFVYSSHLRLRLSKKKEDQGRKKCRPEIHLRIGGIPKTEGGTLRGAGGVIDKREYMIKWGST